MKYLIFAIIAFSLVIKGHSQNIEVKVGELSFLSLFLGIYNDTTLIGTASGFVGKYKDKNYLITNWHVVTNREYYTSGRPVLKGGTPTKLAVYYHSDSVGYFEPRWEYLIQNGKPRWFTFKYFDIEKQKEDTVDVVAIEIESYPKVKYYTIPIEVNLSESQLPSIRPTSELFILGFPNSHRSYKYVGVYKRGTVASEPDLPVNGKPAFYIDATTKKGMSGSPVIFYFWDQYRALDGSLVGLGQPFYGLLGIYSGQDTSTDLGVVIHAKYLANWIDKYGHP